MASAEPLVGDSGGKVPLKLLSIWLEMQMGNLQKIICILQMIQTSRKVLKHLNNRGCKAVMAPPKF